MLTAHHVRETNATLFAPDAEFSAHPDMLVDEPPVVDHFLSVDERVWLRVYYDGSCLHQDGRVTPYAPSLAREQMTLAA